MPGAFDPYHAWLGIPPHRQPPDHYCLLGLAAFEDRTKLIEQAAERRMADLRGHLLGEHGGAAERLLAEVAAARSCLLDAQKKTAYDHQLRQSWQPTAAVDVPKAPPVRRRPAGQKTAASRPDPARAAPGGQVTAESTMLGELAEYELLEKLGEGGMGAVYKARHTKLKRMVALKVLPKGRREDDRAIARFEREMEAVGRLDHPHIVRAMDAREVEGTRFLVMEYVEGLDLGKVVRRLGPLSVADACELVRQAALGLQSAHEHGLVHRDVKPSNLMLTQGGQIKLLDLGLARFQSEPPDGEEMTRTGQALGTLDYMAPEQISDTHSIDIRADIYALGCTLYRLLSGQAPFSGPEYENRFEKMEGHLRKPVPPIGQFRSDVPPELAAVVERMLAKDPAGRFSTPAAVADAVGPFASGSDLPALLVRAGHKPPVVRPDRSLEATAGVSPSSGLTRFLRQLKIQPPPPPSGSEPPPRWPGPVIVAGLATVGVLLVAILIAWAVRSGSGASGAATLVFDAAEGRPDETTLWVDGKRQRLPASGRLSVKCTPGKHRIEAARRGFKPYQQTVNVKAGQRLEILPVWQRQHYLVLRWPAAERRGARLEIDGKPLDVSLPAVQKDAQQIKVPLEPGKYRLRIPRQDFQPFEQQFAIVDGQDTQIEPRWGGDTPPVRLPVPEDDVQQEIARRIDQTHEVTKAQTPQQKRALAGKLLELADQAGERPDERFVLLQSAAKLAAEGGDAALMLRAVEALGAAFKVDLPAERQRAVGEFVRSVTPTAKVHSLIEADGFARAATGSPQIASLVAAAGGLAVADAYWELAQKESDASRSALMLCAGHWYEQAQADTSPGEPKEKAAGRLKEIAPIRVAVQEARAKIERQQQYVEALAPAEKLIAAWDFRAAAAALAELKFDEQDLTARLSRRRDEVQRLAALKTKIIQQLNAHKPPYRKSDLMIPGLPGNLAQADEAAVVAELDNGKTEPLGWKTLGGKTIEKLLALAVDPQSADDQLAAGLLALVVKDTASAERHFDQARTLGTDIAPYLAPLAAASFGEAQQQLQKAQELMDKGQFAEAQAQFTAAEAALGAVKDKYAAIPWFTSHQSRFEAACEEAKAGMSEAGAEGLYVEAVSLFEEKELFDLKPLVEKLKVDYPHAALLTDRQRKPSLAELEKAVADLGTRLTVRADGTGDFKTIQEAIDAAPRNTTIEIQDSSQYRESLHVGADKAGLTFRGKTGSWPILVPDAAEVLRTDAEATMEQLVLMHGGAHAREQPCIIVTSNEGPSIVRVRKAILYARVEWPPQSPARALTIESGSRAELENCILIGDAFLSGSAALRNCLWIVGDIHAQAPCEFRSCTVLGNIVFAKESNVVLNCVVRKIASFTPNTRIDFCDVFDQRPYVDKAKPGKNCLNVDPQFVNPQTLDFQLVPRSPCRGKASDGGDLGCRFTPEMLEMLRLVQELHRQGLIKF